MIGSNVDPVVFKDFAKLYARVLRQKRVDLEEQSSSFDDELFKFDEAMGIPKSNSDKDKKVQTSSKLHLVSQSNHILHIFLFSISKLLLCAFTAK